MSRLLLDNFGPSAVIIPNNHRHVVECGAIEDFGGGEQWCTNAPPLTIMTMGREKTSLQKQQMGIWSSDRIDNESNWPN